MPRGINAFDEALLQKRLWTPRQLLTKLWFDADDLSTITTISGNVSQWNDKSGNGNDASQSTSSNRPSVSVASLNNRNVVTFNGSSQYLNHNYSSGAAPHSVFVVGRRLSGGSTDFQVFINAVAPNTPFGVNISAKASGSVNWGNYINNWTQSNNSCLDTWRIMGIVSPSSSSGNEIFATDGTQVSVTYTARYSGDINNRRAIGGDPTFNVGYLSGNIAEIVHVNRALSTVEQNLLEGYFAHKWGLTNNLPPAHPFRNRPPLLGD
jgi:hypothetical protein